MKTKLVKLLSWLSSSNTIKINLETGQLRMCQLEMPEEISFIRLAKDPILLKRENIIRFLSLQKQIDGDILHNLCNLLNSLFLEFHGL